MPPTPGRRALIGLDERGMVVALHLEHADIAIADVDDAGVLARPEDDMRALGRQLAQVQAGRFIRAMLVPHRRDDAELGERRSPADQLDEARVFVRLQTMRDGERFVDLGFFGAQRASLRLKGESSRDRLRRRRSQAAVRAEASRADSIWLEPRPSLRAQRSNPRGVLCSLDCFVAIARRKTGVLPNALWLLAKTILPKGNAP